MKERCERFLSYLVEVERRGNHFMMLPLYLMIVFVALCVGVIGYTIWLTAATI